MENQNYSIKKYESGWWITFWSLSQNKRIKTNGPYHLKIEAELDMEILALKNERI